MISKICPQCHFENPETAKFCNDCGVKLGSEDIPPSPQPQPSQEPLPPEFLLTPPAAAATAVKSPQQPVAAPAVLSQPVPVGPEASTDEYGVEEAAAEQPFGQRFRIIAELGTGTLGPVYKVFDKAMERELALKAVRPELAQKAEAFEGLSLELKLERGIVHKNIARIFELNVVSGRPFITMEYIAGGDLRFLLKERNRLPVVEAVSIAKQLFSGLAQAHMAGAPHLDLRPENIMIDKEGTVKIMDLGILRLFRARGIIRAVSGRPQYMSPEQLEGQEADARSDIFAAGAIIYELLTAKVPPIGQTVRSPRELEPRIPQQLSLLVLRCIEQDKEKRYQTAHEIVAELEVIETISKQAPAEPPVQLPADKPAPAMPVAKPAAPVPAEMGKVPGPSLTQKQAAARRLFRLPKRVRVPALAVLAVVILAFIVWRFVLGPAERTTQLPAQPAPLSLAVLPFEDLSPAKDRQHLGIALAETLIRSFGKIDNLLIAAAESSSSFQGEVPEAGLIGLRLRVDHFLAGTFEERDNRIKIDARLLRVDSGAPLWSGQFERPTAEVFALEEEIVRAVCKSLGLESPPDSGTAGHKGTPANFEAYDLYAQARLLAGRKGRESLEKAVDLFVKAGEKDPAFAPAFIGLAEAYVCLAEKHYWTPGTAFPKAKETALKALLLDRGEAEAHTVLARIKMTYEWDFAPAEKEYLEALRLDPNNAGAHQGYAVLLSALGRNSEAIEQIQAAQMRNPLSSEVMSQAVAIRFYARLYEDAVAEEQKALAADPLYPGHYLNAAAILIQLNQLDQAGQSLKEAEDLGSDGLEVKLLRACIYARQGQRQEVGRILTEALNASKQVFVSQVSLAFVYAGINEKEQAIACLENAYASHEAALLYLRVHPFLDAVRGDVRFASLLKRVGFESP